MWYERWFLSTNAKDIGILYLMFAVFSGLLGTAFSVLIRLELSGPGVQYIADNQLYNAIITAHAVLMIFFMVNLKSFNILNMKSQLVYNTNTVNENKYSFTYNSNLNSEAEKSLVLKAIGKSIDINISNYNSDTSNSPDKDKKPQRNYVKVLVKDPFNNRDIILKVTKKQKGVYLWESLDGEQKYVGHSINLYNRISSYFMPSILKTKARRVLRYFNKHGFGAMKLTIYIMDENSSLEQVVQLEQYFIDTLKPNLNVDLIVSSSGYHDPMSMEAREKLRKERGISIYVYNAEDFTLLYVFYSKQHMYDSINIHHNTLNDCLNKGIVYLDTLFFSLDLIKESTKTNFLGLDELKSLVIDKRDVYNIKHPASKVILAEFKNDEKKNLKFSSLNSLAKHLKGDRVTIREYLTGKKSGYYRGVWKLTYKN
jgi:hypothetical protein